MAFKHALVVDDSKSARIALKRLLEKHQLIVNFAESGESALEFLKTHHADVIFMDHTMPGMDGLQAVSIIKSDPRTAMIPVMMYTAKEGEVYVGQARALGAIGVLPKQVHPAELFDVLLKLGLVEDRRAAPRPPPAAPAPAYGAEATVNEPASVVAGDAETEALAAETVAADKEPEEPARGMALESLVARILQDQHVELRADILDSHRSFASRVASEIFEKQRKDLWLDHYQPETSSGTGRGKLTIVAVLLLLSTLVLFVLFWQARAERDAVLVENARLADAAQRQAVDMSSQNDALLADIEAERRWAEERYLGLIQALEWGIDEHGSWPFDGLAFDDDQLARLRELLVRLDGVGFEGAVRLEAHLGEFCLVPDSGGGYHPADAELPLGECSYFGHPLDNSVSLNERMSIGFATFLTSSPLATGPSIDVQVVAHDGNGSVRRYPYPATLQNAGEWNAIAALNNRVDYRLIPAAP